MPTLQNSTGAETLNSNFSDAKILTNFHRGRNLNSKNSEKSWGESFRETAASTGKFLKETTKSGLGILKSGFDSTAKFARENPKTFVVGAIGAAALYLWLSRDDENSGDEKSDGKKKGIFRKIFDKLFNKWTVGAGSLAFLTAALNGKFDGLYDWVKNKFGGNLDAAKKFLVATGLISAEKADVLFEKLKSAKKIVAPVAEIILKPAEVLARNVFKFRNFLEAQKPGMTAGFLPDNEAAMKIWIQKYLPKATGAAALFFILKGLGKKHPFLFGIGAIGGGFLISKYSDEIAIFFGISAAEVSQKISETKNWITETAKKTADKSLEIGANLANWANETANDFLAAAGIDNSNSQNILKVFGSWQIFKLGKFFAAHPTFAKYCGLSVAALGIYEFAKSRKFENKEKMLDAFFVENENFKKLAADEIAAVKEIFLGNRESAVKKVEKWREENWDYLRLPVETINKVGEFFGAAGDDFRAIFAPILAKRDAFPNTLACFEKMENVDTDAICDLLAAITKDGGQIILHPDSLKISLGDLGEVGGNLFCELGEAATKPIFETILWGARGADFEEFGDLMKVYFQSGAFFITLGAGVGGAIGSIGGGGTTGAQIGGAIAARQIYKMNKTAFFAIPRTAHIVSDFKTWRQLFGESILKLPKTAVGKTPLVRNFLRAASAETLQDFFAVLEKKRVFWKSHKTLSGVGAKIKSIEKMQRVVGKFIWEKNKVEDLDLDALRKRHVYENSKYQEFTEKYLEKVDGEWDLKNSPTKTLTDADFAAGKKFAQPDGNYKIVSETIDGADEIVARNVKTGATENFLKKELTPENFSQWEKLKNTPIGQKFQKVFELFQKIPGIEKLQNLDPGTVAKMKKAGDFGGDFLPVVGAFFLLNDAWRILKEFLASQMEGDEEMREALNDKVSVELANLVTDVTLLLCGSAIPISLPLVTALGATKEALKSGYDTAKIAEIRGIMKPQHWAKKEKTHLFHELIAAAGDDSFLQNGSKFSVGDKIRETTAAVNAFGGKDGEEIIRENYQIRENILTAIFLQENSDEKFVADCVAFSTFFAPNLFFRDFDRLRETVKLAKNYATVLQKRREGFVKKNSENFDPQNYILRTENLTVDLLSENFENVSPIALAASAEILKPKKVEKMPAEKNVFIFALFEAAKYLGFTEKPTEENLKEFFSPEKKGERAIYFDGSEWCTNEEGYEFDNEVGAEKSATTLQKIIENLESDSANILEHDESSFFQFYTTKTDTALQKHVLKIVEKLKLGASKFDPKWEENLRREKTQKENTARAKLFQKMNGAADDFAYSEAA